MTHEKMMANDAGQWVSPASTPSSLKDTFEFVVVVKRDVQIPFRPCSAGAPWCRPGRGCGLRVGHMRVGLRAERSLGLRGRPCCSRATRPSVWRTLRASLTTRSAALAAVARSSSPRMTLAWPTDRRPPEPGTGAPDRVGAGAGHWPPPRGSLPTRVATSSCVS